MSRKEVHRTIQDLEKELNVIDKLEAFPFAFNIITKKTNGHFHLIILNTKEKNVSVKPFGRDDFEKATKEYDRVERESVDKPEIEAVLVSATEVQEAYPSFFANTKDFKAHLRYVLSGDWLE